MNLIPLLLVVPLAVTAPCAAHSFGPAVADRELATMRGGIRLPDGTDVAIGVAIETQINGVVALRTQFSTLQPGVQVYAGGTPAATSGATVTGTTVVPIVDYDRNAAGTTITVAPAAMPALVTIGGAGSLPVAPGSPLPVQANGPPVATALGSVALRSAGSGFTSELAGSGLDVQQMIGQATGAVVRNTVNNLSISTATWISVDLQGVAVPSNLASTLSTAARAIVIH